MSTTERPVDGLLASLQERAKELNCLYEVEQILARFDIPLEEAFQKVVEVIPPGWQYSDVCCAVIEVEGQRFQTRSFSPTTWVQAAEILVQDVVVGNLSVWYLEERPQEDNGPFLKEEDRLIQTIAERLGHSILFHRMHEMRGKLEIASRELEAEKEDKWRVPIDLLLRTDRHLYLRIARKLVNHLVSTGVDGAQELLQKIYGFTPEEVEADPNLPGRSRALNHQILLSGAPFELAIKYSRSPATGSWRTRRASFPRSSTTLGCPCRRSRPPSTAFTTFSPTALTSPSRHWTGSGSP